MFVVTFMSSPELLVSSLRTVSITLWSLTITLAIEKTGAGFSLQESNVVLVFQFGLLTCFYELAHKRFVFLRGWQLWATLLMVAISTVGGIITKFNTTCQDFQHATSPTGGNIGIAVCVFGCLTTLSILWSDGNTLYARTLFLWILTFILVIVSAEIEVRTWVFEDEQGNIEPMTATGWGLGQVMALCLLVTLVLEIVMQCREITLKNVRNISWDWLRIT